MQSIIGADLTAVAEELDKLPEMRRLARLIGQYQTVRSIRMDLAACRASLDRLHDIEMASCADRSRPLSADDALLGAALALRAVIFYVRSTHTRSEHRGHFDAETLLPDELKPWHRRMVELRNNCMAHFGEGSEGGDYWIRERVTLRAHGDGMVVPSLASTRYNYRGADIQKLSEIIEDLGPKIELAVAEKGRQMMTALDEAEPAVVGPLLQKYPFDPTTFFRDERTVQAWTSGSEELFAQWRPPHERIT